MVLALAKFKDVGKAVDEIHNECNHAEAILGQVDSLLGDPEVVVDISSDRAGRGLLGRVVDTRDDIARILEESRGRLRKYGQGDSVVPFALRMKFVVLDSNKLASLRSSLRQDLGNLQDLMVWVDRYVTHRR